MRSILNCTVLVSHAHPYKFGLPLVRGLQFQTGLLIWFCWRQILKNVATFTLLDIGILKLMQNLALFWARVSPCTLLSKLDLWAPYFLFGFCLWPVLASHHDSVKHANSAECWNVPCCTFLHICTSFSPVPISRVPVGTGSTHTFCRGTWYNPFFFFKKKENLLNFLYLGGGH